ncbi:MAG: complex I NDUFA9 subunit family protein [Usitatibacter sp.]
MRIAKICMIGGSGFVGSAIADHLAEAGKRILVPTRSRLTARRLTVLPTVEIAVADVHDPAALGRAFEGMDAVVNLCGILHESSRQTFEACHVELPRKVAEAARARGVRHLLHMSALGASPEGPSEYLRTKGRGEAALRQAAGTLPFTIFRPSAIFGAGDRFLNLFASLARLPLLPLAAAGARFQPVWVEDVARCFVAALGDPRTFGQAYELAGPRVYTLAELVRLAADAAGRKARIVALPGAAATLQAFTFEHLPGKLMTRDNLRSMSVDNVTASDFPAIFGFRPSPPEAVVPAYLAPTGARARYSGYRHYAGR